MENSLAYSAWLTKLNTYKMNENEIPFTNH